MKRASDEKMNSSLSKLNPKAISTERSETSENKG
jgi:hypothetical protein